MAGETDKPVAKSCTVSGTSRHNYRTELLVVPVDADQSTINGKVFDPEGRHVENISSRTIVEGPIQAANRLLRITLERGAKDVQLKCEF